MPNNRCFTPQYFNSNSQIGVRLNFLPVFGDTATGYNFEAFLPFIIVGVYALNSGAVPNGAVGDAVYGWRSNNDLATFPYMELEQNLMVANRDGANQSGSLVYTKNQAGEDFSKYFKRSMQGTLQTQNFQAMIQPAFLVSEYWKDYQVYAGIAATFDAMRTKRFLEMVEYVSGLTDLRFWQAPGKYTMAGAPPNVDAYFGPFDAVMTGASLGDLGLITAEVKSIE